MGDRLCKICDKVFTNAEIEDFQVVQFGVGHQTELVLDRKNGITHELLSEKKSQRILLKQGKSEETIVVVPASSVTLRPQPLDEPKSANEVLKTRPFIKDEERLPEPRVLVISPVMRGKVFVVPIPGKSPGQILSEGYRYLCFQDDIEGDVYGRQYLSLHEEVEFQPIINQRGNKHASQIKPLGRSEEVRDHSYREDGWINEWHSNNGTGFATRMTGESVHVSVEDVVTDGELGFGVQIRFKPCPPNRSNRKIFRAKEIEIYQSEFSDTQPAQAEQE